MKERLSMKKNVWLGNSIDISISNKNESKVLVGEEGMHIDRKNYDDTHLRWKRSIIDQTLHLLAYVDEVHILYEG